MEGDDDSTGYSVGRSPSNCPRSACSPNSSCSNDPVDMSFMMIDYLKDAMKVFFKINFYLNNVDKKKTKHHVGFRGKPLVYQEFRYAVEITYLRISISLRLRLKILISSLISK